MSHSDECTIHTDGGARGNPGPAAFAFILERTGLPVVEGKGFLGEATNNVAEYTALIRALEKARDLSLRRVHIKSDSDLMVQQMKGSYKVKNEGLRPLYEKAQGLLSHFDEVTFRHIPREENKRADRLYNQAMDEALGKKPKAKTSSPGGTTGGGVDPRQRVDADAVECLRSAAEAWVQGNANFPRPEDVWDQLWSILEEAGAVKSPKK